MKTTTGEKVFFEHLNVANSHSYERLDEKFYSGDATSLDIDERTRDALESVQNFINILSSDEMFMYMSKVSSKKRHCFCIGDILISPAACVYAGGIN